jgi:hypothetical protein
VIGLSGAGYYFGFIVGCWVTPWLLRSAGHIRAFRGHAAIAACASLAMVIVIDPFFWFLMRLVTGICFASMFANVESWINAQVTNSNRARTLAIYRFVDLGAVTAVAIHAAGFRHWRFRDIRGDDDADHPVDRTGVARRPLQPRPAGAVFVQSEASVRGVAAGLRRVPSPSA